MELKQALGNTWYLEDWQLIPLYRTDENHCILLDTGLYSQRRDIEATLAAAGLTPIGILGSHAHNDHSSNHHYFQQRYHIPVALSLGEAGLCCSMESLKSHFYMNSMGKFSSNQQFNHMVVRTDRVILPEEEKINFCGVEFQIVHTPGHSVDPIAVTTPDGVFYLGDALLTGSELDSARFPYHFCFQQAIETMKKLPNIPARRYLAAHRGVYKTLADFPQRNIRLIESRAEGILKCLDRPLDLSELSLRVCETFHLRSRSKVSTALYERNIHSYLEYLLDTERVVSVVKNGIFYYQAN